MSIGPFVTVDWLAERLAAPDIVVVDGSWYLPAMGRDAEAEFRAAHIPGAIRFDIDAVRDEGSALPHMLPSPEAFASRMRQMGIGDGMTVVVYDGMGLFSAPRVRWTLKAFGAREVAVLEGGLPAWVAGGHPVEEGEARPRDRRHFTARLDHSAVANVGDVQRALAGSAQMVDARSAARFAGEEAEPRPGVRPGHMPGALNLHYAALQENGRLKDEAALREAVARAGIDLDRPVVTTCGSGVTAAIVGIALESLGRPPRSLYDGSWSEWGAREDLPVATGR
ncbi:3-mercaptopyruvate sulfurtransferase [Methylobacterium indicum]|nr:3-mercaptopyruvate sulfurtransferase [Methylobacterium indicum]KMO11356.1 3-mercaptopyruvate sulfurtransferase [Methylobacterium indicum]KMO14800.1 3-mercaptopyruvate sulfurtransferase [Methylobacterium indicum]KTS24713.1 3-mercaptopyruvate sulfurtransferase [Methylobacterium indicum]KTS26879.1 3-mercaptopyruvate sulfurtransferase [Methylobacterium indicum]KTS45889.1 3-mercaptopyruvate sulfurtransferase [Methylobacterium indicum]